MRYTIVIEQAQGSQSQDEPLVLSADDEDELLAAISEIERGEFVSTDELLDSLRRFG